MQSSSVARPSSENCQTNDGARHERLGTITFEFTKDAGPDSTLMGNDHSHQARKTSNVLIAADLKSYSIHTVELKFNELEAREYLAAHLEQAKILVRKLKKVV